MNFNIKNNLLTIVKSIHLVYSLIILIGPFITNNKLFLSFLISNYSFLLTSWYMNGNCILTSIEQYLGGINSRYDDNKEKSFITEFLVRIFGVTDKNINMVLTIIPFINTNICLYKLL